MSRRKLEQFLRISSEQHDQKVIKFDKFQAERVDNSILHI